MPPACPSPDPGPLLQVVRPLRTFLHTVQRNQMLMTPTSASRSSVMKSFIKRNTPLRVDPKVREPAPQATLRGRLRGAASAAGSSVGLGQLRPLWPWAPSTSGDCPDLLGSVLCPRGLASSVWPLGLGPWAGKLQNFPPCASNPHPQVGDAWALSHVGDGDGDGVDERRWWSGWRGFGPEQMLA